ncbi:hypothetical protein F5B22DRAFT_648189 [Xylaria bambusicola]|uniref:uncharacterized protein n=1 Tax=Xylaria bambusicola TaxID=326684 RepID=UPI002007D9D6|nr:uncharacterized protein F5B22DRAFT_648189 [Xylaria bambusicola]KAI0512840.1 hypothetical protein F5B22DRAFT_648189 [Xylaria bambusicola]
MGSPEFEGDLPFGYHLNLDDTVQPPPSPHGIPILDPTDSNVLGTFFNRLNNLQPNDWPMQSYGNGLPFNESWINPVAPNLLGHSTSFGSQPPPDLASAAITGQSPVNFQDGFTFVPTMPHMIPPPPPPELPLQQQQAMATRIHPHQQSHLDQRLLHAMVEQNAHTDAAASLTTLQSGHAYSYSPNMASINRLQQSPITQPPRDYRNSLSQSHPMQGQNAFVRSTRTNEPETLFRDMMFGTQGSTAQRTEERSELQWGSDTTFGMSQGFVPPQHESSEALVEKRMATMREALHLTSSDPNTRASSPAMNDEVATQALLENSNGNNKVQGNPATHNKKRKTKPKIEEEDEVEDKVPIPQKPITKKRKSGIDLNELPGSSLTQEVAGKRRKSGPNQPKPPRENLTEAQKRENHIKSEQKRRLAIKEGFEDLAFIIPNLQNGGYSKSTTLNMAGEWIESLIEGNQKLKRILSPFDGEEEAEAGEDIAP